jgi:hypothetical protein
MGFSFDYTQGTAPEEHLETADPGCLLYAAGG